MVKIHVAFFNGLKRQKKMENNVAFIPLNKTISFLSISKTAKKLIERVIFKILLK